MERPKKEDYDFNDIFELLKFINLIMRYADYLEGKEKEELDRALIWYGIDPKQLDK